MPSRHQLVGELQWSDHKNMHVSGLYDRIAIGGNVLALLSFVAPAGEVKAMRAALATNTKDSMTLSGQLPEGRKKDDRLLPVTEGYHVWAHRLPYGMVHALFIGRTPGLLMNASDDVLWAALKHERFTTPLLRAWLTYIKEGLEEKKKLYDCACVGCNCRLLNARTEDLDELVASGLKSGFLRIEEEHNESTS